MRIATLLVLLVVLSLPAFAAVSQPSLTSISNQVRTLQGSVTTIQAIDSTEAQEESAQEDQMLQQQMQQQVEYIQQHDQDHPDVEVVPASQDKPEEDTTLPNQDDGVLVSSNIKR